MVSKTVTGSPRASGARSRAASPTAVFALFVLLLFPVSDAAGKSRPSSGQKKSFELAGVLRTTLHNATGSDFFYLVKPLYADILPEQRELAPDAAEIFPADSHFEIRILPEESSLVYWLFPGEHYIVRELGGAGFRIFKRSRNHPEALDLAPFVATPMLVVDRMLELAGVRAESVVFDLGCGDGRVVVAAAQEYGARGVGIDIDPARIAEARIRAREAGVEERVRFYEQDIFEADISPATVVYLYLYPDSNRLLRPFLEERLKPGTTVVCHDFLMPGWRERLIDLHEIEVDHGMIQTLFIYRR